MEINSEKMFTKEKITGFGHQRRKTPSMTFKNYGILNTTCLHKKFMRGQQPQCFYIMTTTFQNTKEKFNTSTTTLDQLLVYMTYSSCSQCSFSENTSVTPICAHSSSISSILDQMTWKSSRTRNSKRKPNLSAFMSGIRATLVLFFAVNLKIKFSRSLIVGNNQSPKILIFN